MILAKHFLISCAKKGSLIKFELPFFNLQDDRIIWDLQDGGSQTRELRYDELIPLLLSVAKPFIHLKIHRL